MKKLRSAGLALLLVLTSAFSALAAPSVPPARAPAASGSNAIDFDDLMSGRLPVASGSDADSIPYSSLGSVTNTVDYSAVDVIIYCYRDGKTLGRVIVKLDPDGYFHTTGTGRWPDADSFRVYFSILPEVLPSSGTYLTTVDFSSDFSLKWDERSHYAFFKQGKISALQQTSYYQDNVRQNPGDFQFQSVIDIGSNLKEMSLGVSTDEIIPSEGIGGYVKINFTVSSESTNISTPGTGSGASTQDFQNGVTDIMGNISDTLVEIVAAISDQLKALWDQMYNFMHLEQLKNDDKNTGQIVDAINNQGSQVGQDITNSIDNNTQNIINNNNQNFDNLQNGYDNTGMNSDKDKLDNALNGYDELEGEYPKVCVNLQTDVR